MARIARVVVPGYPHHVTQRGNRRQITFSQTKIIKHISDCWYSNAANIVSLSGLIV